MNKIDSFTILWILLIISFYTTWLLFTYYYIPIYSMQTFFLITLFLFWLLFGSFASVIIYRIKSGEAWIMTGRSHCWSCNKLLQALDLIPLFSWLINKWKCRQCKAKVSGLYPILELSTWVLFSLVWFFLIDSSLIFLWDTWEITKLFFWLLIAFITIIYFFYDILFLEISERILATGVWVAVIWVIIQSYSSIQIFPSLPIWVKGDLLSLNHSLWFLLLTIIALYIIILKNLAEIWDFVILIILWIWLYVFNTFFTDTFSLTQFPAISASIWAIAIFIFFFLQIVVSGWKWMWWGDLRIAILVWLILWTTLWFPAMMLTYFAGSIIWVWFIIHQRFILKKGWELNTQIPFGPFIAIWFFLAIFFQGYILEFMERFLYV